MEHPAVIDTLQEKEATIEAQQAQILVLDAQLLHLQTDYRDAQDELAKLEARLQWQESQRERFPEYMRLKIIAWAGECMSCGATELLTADHVIPVNKGGKSTWDNGQCLCQSCNSKKGDQTDDGWDFRRFYPDFMKQCEQEEERGTFQGNLF